MKPFEKKIWLSSPTMHGEEMQFVNEAIETNWVSTVGANTNILEEMTAKICGGPLLRYSCPSYVHETGRGKI